MNKEKKYNTILLVLERNRWEDCSSIINQETDVVFTLDFGLKNKLDSLGIEAHYLDCLLSSAQAAKLNNELHYFLFNWHKTIDGAPLFPYKKHDLGDAMLLNVLNEITNFCHFFFNFLELGKLKYKRLAVSLDPELITILDKTCIPYTVIPCGNYKTESPTYWFPITKWMKTKIKPGGISYRMKAFARNCVDVAMGVIDRLFPQRHLRSVYIHSYHATQPIIDQLLRNSKYRVINETYGRRINWLRQRRILYRNHEVEDNQTQKLIRHFDEQQKLQWNYNSHLVSDYLYERIRPIILEELRNAISFVVDIHSYFKCRKLDVMIPISNLYMPNRLLMQYCFQNKVPVFLIINGLLSLSFWKDAKDSDWVNCYSQTIKEDYFNNVSYAIPLGDPRMDHYAEMPRKIINRDNPVIVIGSSAFNLLDLNSFMAVEYDFIYTVFNALLAQRNEGRFFSIIVKVRANGYVDKYRSFFEEYFPSFQVEIESDKPFSDIISKADLYVSFYSQTLFEAACIGVPVIYLKNDHQKMLRPFNGESELVTVYNANELVEAFRDFFNNSPRFAKFNKRDVIEKYIGPIDGQNVNRNIKFIEQLLNKPA